MRPRVRLSTDGEPGAIESTAEHEPLFAARAPRRLVSPPSSRRQHQSPPCHPRGEPRPIRYRVKTRRVCQVFGDIIRCVFCRFFSPSAIAGDVDSPSTPRLPGPHIQRRAPPRRAHMAVVEPLRHHDHMEMRMPPPIPPRCPFPHRETRPGPMPPARVPAQLPPRLVQQPLRSPWLVFVRNRERDHVNARLPPW